MNTKQSVSADTAHPATMTSATISVSSSAFQSGAAIPQRYSCDGENISPAVSWGSAPSGTQSFALVCEDPDAPSGMFVHWVAYNIPASERGMPEHVATNDTLANGIHQGKNGAGKTGYTGPCPPPGKPHHYHFRIFALDTKLNLSGDVDRKRLLAAIDGHVLAEGEVTGTYQR